MSKLLKADCPSPPAAFPFENKYVEILGHKIHYIEEGRGDPILFIHGNPTNSYLYRNVVSPVSKATNRRCIALDMLGFGKSDKPDIEYILKLHANIIRGFIEKLKLKKIILVAEDWGGFLGGYIMVKEPQLFQSAVLMETFLWPMNWKDDFDPKFVIPFKIMRSPVGALFSRGMNMMVKKLIPEHCPISKQALQYYIDSLPDWKTRKAMGTFPKLLPLDKNPLSSYNFAMEIQEGLKNIKFPVLWIKADPGVVVSNVNPIGMGRLNALKKSWPEMIVRDFGPGFHFLTEERPEHVAKMINDWIIEKKFNG